MNFRDFYQIASYGNEMWKGSFTAEEIAQNAYDYITDFQWSKENKIVAYNIQELSKLLAEDGSEECKDWLYEMATELGLLDMDFMDYMETDIDIISMFLAKPNKTQSKIKISSIIFEHGEDDYELWEEFALSKEDQKAILKILQKYETGGCSVRGTRKEIAKEMGE